MDKKKIDKTKSESYPDADTLVLVKLDDFDQTFALREMRCDVDGVEWYDEANIIDDSGYEPICWWSLPEHP